MQVEIDLFSGQPNPFWELTEAEVAEFKARLNALPASALMAMPELLGYRGLNLGTLPGLNSRREPLSPDLILSAQMGGGAIKVTLANGTTLYRKDPGRSIECWLLTLAQGRVDESTRKIALANLGMPCP